MFQSTQADKFSQSLRSLPFVSIDIGILSAKNVYIRKMFFHFLGCAPWYASRTVFSVAYAVYICVDARSECPIMV